MAGFPANRDITEILIRYASYRLLLYRKGVTVSLQLQKGNAKAFLYIESQGL